MAGGRLCLSPQSRYGLSKSDRVVGMNVRQAFGSVSTLVNLAFDHWFGLRLSLLMVPGPPAHLVILQKDSFIHSCSLLQLKDTKQDQQGGKMHLVVMEAGVGFQWSLMGVTWDVQGDPAQEREAHRNTRVQG